MTPSTERLQELLEEATVDAYGDDEEFSSVLITLDENPVVSVRLLPTG